MSTITPQDFARMWYAGGPESEAEEDKRRIAGLSSAISDFQQQTQNEIADWFENSGIETFTAKQVAQVIRKWRKE